MTISQVRVQVDGTWHTLTLNGSTGKYEKTITAPSTTSYNLSGGYYPLTVEVTNTAGTKTTKNHTDATLGSSLRLTVKETVKPTVTIMSPANDAHVSNNRQPIVFKLRDEAGGSGINLSSLEIKKGTTLQSLGANLVATPVSDGYDCTWTPPSALSDGSHMFTINVSDNDGNTPTFSATRAFTVDTIPPTLSVSNPSNGFVTNNSTMVVQGSTNDVTSSPVTVSIKLNNVDQGTIPLTSGNFSKSLTLANGSNTIVVTSADGVGRVTTVTITGTLDTSAPVISSVTLTPNPVDAGASVVISVTVTG